MSWHQPLDGSESRIQHMLMVEDAQMHITIHTAFGYNKIKLRAVNLMWLIVMTFCDVILADGATAEGTSVWF